MNEGFPWDARPLLIGEMSNARPAGTSLRPEALMGEVEGPFSAAPDRVLVRSIGDDGLVLDEVDGHRIGQVPVDGGGPAQPVFEGDGPSGR